MKGLDYTNPLWFFWVNFFPRWMYLILLQSVYNTHKCNMCIKVLVEVIAL